MAKTVVEHSLAKSRQRNSQKSKQALLDAAIDIFAQRGPEAATVDEICQKADLNKRMIYHYFDSKEKLYEQTLSHMYDELLALNISLKSMLLDPEELLETIIRQYHTFLQKHRNFVRLICYENLYSGKTIKKLKLGTRKAPVITAIQVALEKGRAENKFRNNIDAKKLLVTIMGICFFYFSNEYTMRELVGDMSMTKPALEKQVKHVLDILLNGIRKENKHGR
jgi:AcrR family transcriptional regulator